MTAVVLTIMMNLFAHFYRCLLKVEYWPNWWHNNCRHHENPSTVLEVMAIEEIKFRIKRPHKSQRGANDEKDAINMRRKNRK